MIPTPQPPVRGVLPIAPTPFTGSGDIDVAGQRRVLDCMIDQGVDAICVLANFSEQFLLTDDERNELTEVCLTHVGDRVPVIVTCSHFSTRIAAERGRRAAALGASMVMLMPPYHGVGLRADEDAMLAHFATVADAAILPLINFENRQCGLRACKTVMKEGGVIKSDAVRHPLEPLHPATRAGLLELAAEVQPLALRWGR